jgi:glycosyltransferase involved in cell wall biosynthesis
VGVSVAAAAYARGLPRPERDIRCIPNGVDLARFPPLAPAPPLSGGRLSVVGVGRLVPQKGFDVLVRAAAGLPVQVTLAGEGPDAAALAALARGLEVELRLPGWQPRLGPLLESAHLVAIPSRWEGFGLVAVEALASRRAVLASDAPPLPALVGDAGRCVARGRVEPLRAALEALLDEPLREALASAGPARAARWDVRHTVAAYEALYRELVDRPSHGA